MAKSRLGFDLILLGAPAAGKDTQADKLLKKLSAARPVRSGAYWRRVAKQNNAQGELLRRTVGRGYAAPVKLMRQFIERQLQSAKSSHDLIFIGNPRLVPEAKLLNKLLSTKNRDYMVLALTLPDQVVRRRSALRHRDEQDKKYVGNRIKMYKTQVSKTLQYFRSLGKLKTINGNQTIAQVHRDIIKQINDYQRSKRNSVTQRKRPYPG
jgi:adenylate kinase